MGLEADHAFAIDENQGHRRGLHLRRDLREGEECLRVYDADRIGGPHSPDELADGGGGILIESAGQDLDALGRVLILDQVQDLGVVGSDRTRS